VQASAGYAPSLFARGPPNGYDFAMTNVNAGAEITKIILSSAQNCFLN
jgi:hypothetical protein